METCTTVLIPKTKEIKQGIPSSSGRRAEVNFPAVHIGTSVED